MHTTTLLLVYCILVVLASLAGGALPGVIKLTHRRMQFVMSFVGGLMLGVALLHLIPHSLAEQGSIDRLAGWSLGGLLTMFLLIRVFHVHAHEHGDTSDVIDQHLHDHNHEGPCDHQHNHGHQHDHPHGAAPAGHHAFSWFGLAFGLSLHTLIDGLALGAAVMAEAQEEHGFALFGLGTFLAVALHKPLDALSITSLMAAGGWSKGAIRLANTAFALMCPLGALGFVFGLTSLFAQQRVVIGCALAFAAGVFLCISLADLLPEVAFHTHDRLRLTLALFLGIALAWAIGFLEPKHSHELHKNQAHSIEHPANRRLLRTAAFQPLGLDNGVLEQDLDAGGDRHGHRKENRGRYACSRCRVLAQRRKGLLIACEDDARRGHRVVWTPRQIALRCVELRLTP